MDLSDIFQHINLSRFHEARCLIETGVKTMDHEWTDLHLKFLRIYIAIKEKEHKNRLNIQVLESSLNELLTLAKEFQLLAVTIDTIDLQLLFCSSILSIFNASHHIQLQCILQQVEFCRLVLRFCENFFFIYWNDLKVLPPKMQATSEVDLNTAVHEAAQALCVVGKTLQEMTEPSVATRLLSFMIDFLLWIFSSHYEGCLAKSVINCITSLLTTENKLQMKAVELQNVGFIIRTVEDIHDHFEIFKMLYCLFENEIDDLPLEKNFKIAPSYNCMTFLLLGICLFRQEHYGSCWSHLAAILHSNVLASRLSIKQLAITQILYLLSAIKTGKQERAKQLLAYPYSGDFQLTTHLNKFAFYSNVNDIKKSIASLNKVLEIDGSDNNEMLVIISNFDFLMDNLVLQKMDRVCPPVENSGSRFCLYVSRLPAIYVYYHLGRLYWKQARYSDVCRCMTVLFQHLEEPITPFKSYWDMSLGQINTTLLYRQYCACCISLRRFDEALRILNKLKMKDREVNIWVFVYEAELYRLTKDFVTALELLNRTLLTFDCVNAEDLKPDSSTDKDETHVTIFHKYHILNNLAVTYISMKDEQSGFVVLKRAIQQCHTQCSLVFSELVYNYCKWLHDFKSNDISLSNWNAFYDDTNIEPSFLEPYKTVL